MKMNYRTDHAGRRADAPKPLLKPPTMVIAGRTFTGDMAELIKIGRSIEAGCSCRHDTAPKSEAEQARDLRRRLSEGWLGESEPATDPNMPTDPDAALRYRLARAWEVDE